MRSIEYDERCADNSKRDAAIDAGEKPEEVEVVAKGDYYYRNGHHFICYEEVQEGYDTITKNMIKVMKVLWKYRKKDSPTHTWSLRRPRRI